MAFGQSDQNYMRSEEGLICISKVMSVSEIY